MCSSVEEVTRLCTCFPSSLPAKVQVGTWAPPLKAPGETTEALRRSFPWQQPATSAGCSAAGLGHRCWLASTKPVCPIILWAFKHPFHQFPFLFQTVPVSVACHQESWVLQPVRHVVRKHQRPVRFPTLVYETFCLFRKALKDRNFLPQTASTVRGRSSGLGEGGPSVRSLLGHQSVRR